MNPLMLFSLLAVLFVFGFCLARIFTQSGLHRFPGGLAALVLLLVFLKIFVDISGNPSAHNLLPFELLIWSVLALVIYWLAETIMTRIASKNDKSSDRN